MRKMKLITIALIAIALMLELLQISVNASCIEDYTENGVTFKAMEATAYCTGTTRCDGLPVRTGICAGKKEWYGMTACVYLNKNGAPGEFLGYYECLDTGGDERIQNGQVLDLYFPNCQECIEFGRQQVFVVLVNGKG